MKDFELIRSSRKTLAIEIRGQRVIVRAPNRASRRDIEAFVAEHEAWIEKQLAKNAERQEALQGIEPLSEEEIKTLAKKLNIRSLKTVQNKLSSLNTKITNTINKKLIEKKFK